MCACQRREKRAEDDINIKTESDPPTFLARRAGPSVRASAPVVVDQVDAGAGVLAGRRVALVDICGQSDLTA